MILTGRQFYRAGVKLGGGLPSEDPMAFSFTLGATRTTSIGIYNSEGDLIRTIESGISYGPNTYNKVWDGYKDPVYNGTTKTWEFVAADPGNYKAKVQTNALAAAWEGGRIGNYSTALTGPTKHRGFQFYTDIAMVGDTAYCIRNYEEGWSAITKFNVNTPYERTRIRETFQTNATGSAICSDGTHVFIGGEDSFASARPSFVWAFRVSDDSEVTNFNSGISYSRGNSIRNYPSVLNKLDGVTTTSSQIAIGFNPTVTVASTAGLNVNDIVTFASTTDGGNIKVGGYTIAAQSFKILSIINSTSFTIETTTTGTSYTSANLIVAPSITGIAVNSTYLFVAKYNLNTITVINKTTGAIVSTLSSIRPQRMVCDTDGNLWVVSSYSTVTKYSVGVGGTSITPLLTLSGIVRPTSITFRDYDDTMVIPDGNGGNDCFKAFNLSGVLQWSHGTGSYNTDPRVYNNKFMLYDRNTNASGNTFNGFVACHADGSMWLGDSGNYRVIKVDVNKNYQLTTGYLPHSYSMQVCQNDPTRVFSEYMEFKIDYSKPLEANNGSWELVRNYRGAIPDDYHASSMKDVFKSVCTLSQTGRTYGMLKHKITYKPIVVELPLDAPVRFTKVELSLHETTNIHHSGDLRRVVIFSSGASFTLYNRAYVSTDVDGDPVWATQAGLENVTTTAVSDPINFIEQRSGRQTTNEYFIMSNPEGEQQNRGEGWHLGAYKNNKWKWKTSRATGVSYTGPFPTDGSFDTGNGTEAPGAGGELTLCENIIVQQYRGEFWKQSQTNYYLMFSQEGLYLGMFGTWKTNNFTNEAAADLAGNAFNAQLVKVGSDLYLYTSDESIHAGVHRWKINGQNTIQIQEFDLVLGA